MSIIVNHNITTGKIVKLQSRFHSKSIPSSFKVIPINFNWNSMLFLAPSGAQVVEISVSLSVTVIVCLELWIFIFLAQVSLSFLLAYFVGKTEPKILRLVGLVRSMSSCHRTWLRKWHSLADFATTSEEKMHETRIMLSAKYKRVSAIFKVQKLPARGILYCDCK